MKVKALVELDISPQESYDPDTDEYVTESDEAVMEKLKAGGSWCDCCGPNPLFLKVLEVIE